MKSSIRYRRKIVDDHISKMLILMLYERTMRPEEW